MFENVEKFKYLGVTNTYDIGDEIKRRMNMENVCYYSFEKILWSRLLSKILKVNHMKLICYLSNYIIVKFDLSL